MERETPQNSIKKRNTSLAHVGLSYSLQSHRNLIQISHNELTGELKIQPFAKSLLTKQKSDHDRYKRDGKLFVNGLTAKGKGKIQKASRTLEQVHTIEKGLKAYCSLITLTYGKDYPTDHDSKKHLDTFLKRLRRLHKDCKYVWVAEKQKRGAIHYHILTPYYTPKEWVNNSWNEIVSSWQINNGYDLQTLLPNVIKVNQAGAYMAKYLSKEAQNIGGNGYGIDQQTRALMKDETIYLVHHDRTPEEVNTIVTSLHDTIKQEDQTHYTWQSKYTSYMGAWHRAVNYYSLKEWLNYTRHEFELMTEHELTQNTKHKLHEVLTQRSELK